MIEIYNLGISEDTIKSMLEINPDIKELEEEEVIEKEVILESLKCNREQIISIISSNPMYLTRTNEDIYNLITYLNELGFTDLNILFDSNPYILNLDPFEITHYIQEKIVNKKTFEDIIDELESNPYLFSEI